MKTSTWPMKTSTAWTIGSVIAVAVAIAAIWIVSSMSNAARTQAGPTDASPTVAEDSHRLTDPEGSTVTFVEFLDFECEVCGAVYPSIERLKAEYADRVTFVVRYFPIPGHRNSMTSAVAVEAAAKQGRFEDMYQRMFTTQAEWGEQQDSKAEMFRGFAEDLGLDLAAYNAAVADPATETRVRADFDAGRSLGVNGTPTIFINDRLVEFRSEADLRDALQRALNG